MNIVVEADGAAQHFDGIEQRGIHFSGVSRGEGTFFRDIKYQISRSDIDCVLLLDTLMDTGSVNSLVKASLVPMVAIEDAREFDQVNTGIHGSILAIHGILKLDVTIGGVMKKNQIILVVPDTTMGPSIILGRDVMVNFGLTLTIGSGIVKDEVISFDRRNSFHPVSQSIIINPHLSIGIRSIVGKLFQGEYFKVTRPDGPNVNMELNLHIRYPEPFFHAPPNLSVHESRELGKILETLEEKEIIRPSHSRYVSPITLVKKENGEFEIRMNYGHLNGMISTSIDRPTINRDPIAHSRNKKYFSTFHLTNGLFPIRMGKNSIQYTAFATPFGIFEFVKMPTGLEVGRLRFDKFVRKALADLIDSGDIIYMGHVSIATHTIVEHMSIMMQLLKALNVNFLALSVDQCRILFT